MAVIPFNLFASQTGLTLEAQPRDATNVALGSPLTVGFTEKGGGVYQWEIQPLPAGTATVDVQLQSDHSFLGVSLGGADLGFAPPWYTASSGSGTFTYTITVSDGVNPVAGAAVSLTNGVTVLQATANSFGVATFNVDAATWVLAVFKSGYSYPGSSVSISGNGNTSVTVTATVTPLNPGPGQIVGWIYTQNPGTIITYRATGVPAGAGFEFDGSEQAAASDAFTGYWQALFYKGVPYTLQSGDSGPPLAFTVPTTGTSFSIANILGIP